ncbi:hypothetical protein AGMMS50218_12640 [Actinomycetota bacterium]|nr:hypothetical protein AGMMS50218_12640 [Actinomycetota bacterium]
MPLSTTVTPGQDSETLPPNLREQWRLASVESVWLRPADWYHPAVDALIESLLDDRDVAGPAERLGAVRYDSGVGLTESIDDLACLFRSAGRDEPPLPVVRALCEGWSAASTRQQSSRRCLEPESGLTTGEYLAARLHETYEVAERDGSPVPQTHCLVVVDAASGAIAPWHRMARSAALGEALRRTFGASRPTAALGSGLFVALLPRDRELGAQVAAARAEIDRTADELQVAHLLRQPLRLWVEQLPPSHALAVDLLHTLVSGR